MKWKFAILLFFAISFVYGQANYRVSSYYLVVKGTSNLHDWESKANEVRANGSMTVDATGILKSIQSLYVEVPVKAIKSQKGSIMDNKTYNALKADAFPNITFKLDKITGLGKRGDIYDVNAAGALTIAGSTNKIDIYVQGKLDGNSGIIFSGAKKLKMTDYKINPPTALMGTLTTGNEVEIAFQVTLKQF